jgi:homospermidine synthase
MTTPRSILLIGYGSVGQALTPLLLKHFALMPAQVRAIAADENGRSIAEHYGLDYLNLPLTKQNYAEILAARLCAGDWLINVAVEVSSLALIGWCQTHGVLYLDTCVEPWAGGYTASDGRIEATTNYALRHAALALHRPGAPTAVIAHGANPGLVSHFVKAGLLQLAQQRGYDECLPREAWGKLACDLGIQAIHIAERDSQQSASPLGKDLGREFVNTWSVDGLLAEAGQCAELGWGSHERDLPIDAHVHYVGDRSGIYLGAPSATVKIKSWTPAVGEQSAYLITHHEALSIAHLLTVPSADTMHPAYRPTVYYAYRPTPATCASLDAWIANDLRAPQNKHVLRDALVDGFDQLGVLFIFSGGAYWYGSTLTLEEARTLAPHNNATSLQVVAGILGALDWLSRYPNAGVIEAESLNFAEVLAVARPYLGTISGVATDWQPGASGDLQFSTFRLQHLCEEKTA